VGATAAHGDILHQRLQQLPNINKKDEPKKKKNTEETREISFTATKQGQGPETKQLQERERKKTTKKTALRKKPIATD